MFAVIIALILLAVVAGLLGAVWSAAGAIDDMIGGALGLSVGLFLMVLGSGVSLLLGAWAYGLLVRATAWL